MQALDERLEDDDAEVAWRRYRRRALYGVLMAAAISGAVHVLVVGSLFGLVSLPGHTPAQTVIVVEVIANLVPEPNIRELDETLADITVEVGPPLFEPTCWQPEDLEVPEPLATVSNADSLLMISWSELLSPITWYPPRGPMVVVHHSTRWVDL
jgi:hypothetical protein